MHLDPGDNPDALKASLRQDTDSLLNIAKMQAMAEVDYLLDKMAAMEASSEVDECTKKLQEISGIGRRQEDVDKK